MGSLELSGWEGAGEQLSAREAAKLERAEQARLDELAKQLARKLKDALRTPPDERSDAATSLLAEHAEEARRLQAAMMKSAARKAADAANMAEIEDDAAVLEKKLETLAEMMRTAKHVVVYTGAGISTAASIPDYRGPRGIWTQMKSQAAKGCAGSVSSGSRAGNIDKLTVEPTRAHMVLATLVNTGRVKMIISQNVDGLHIRSGIPLAKLCELHGNVFRERCKECGHEYLRGFDVTGLSSYHRHATERQCTKQGCRATLHDTIVYFGEKVHDATLSMAQEASRRADLALFVGSSLKVLQYYRYIWEQCPGGSKRKSFAIVNLQPTPKDKVADLVVRGRCDDVLSRLASALGLRVHEYDPTRDAVLRLCSSKPRNLAHPARAPVPVQAAPEQEASVPQCSRQHKETEPKPCQEKQAGDAALNDTPMGKLQGTTSHGSGASKVKQGGRMRGKTSKVVLCCRCGIMLDDERGKTVRDGCGICDCENCDHWACIPCSGVEPGYSGQWFCGCSTCAGARAGSPLQKTGMDRASDEISHQSASDAGKSDASPSSASKRPVAQGVGSNSKKARLSKVVLCCRCGIMLDNEKGKTVRDGCGTCDGEGCEHWACIPCSGVETGYDGEWFCGCDTCAGKAPDQWPMERSEGSATTEGGASSRTVATQGKETLDSAALDVRHTEGEQVEGQCKKAVKRAGDARRHKEGAGSIVNERGQSAAMTLAAKSSELREKSKAKREEAAKASKVVLCCRCGVMLDNERGKTIRDGCGTCDGDGCDHWACMPCSGVEPGYDGEWFCGCSLCTIRRDPSPEKAPAGSISASRATQPAERRTRTSSCGNTKAQVVSAQVATATAPKEEPAVHTREADENASSSPSHRVASKAIGEQRKTSKVVLCCCCGVMLDNARGKTVRDGCGPCDWKDCDHWACIPCSKVETGYDGDWFCGCSTCGSIEALHMGSGPGKAVKDASISESPEPRRKRHKSGDGSHEMSGSPIALVVAQPFATRRGKSAEKSILAARAPSPSVPAKDAAVIDTCVKRETATSTPGPPPNSSNTSEGTSMARESGADLSAPTPRRSLRETPTHPQRPALHEESHAEACVPTLQPSPPPESPLVALVQVPVKPTPLGKASVPQLRPPTPQSSSATPLLASSKAAVAAESASVSKPGPSASQPLPTSQLPASSGGVTMKDEVFLPPKKRQDGRVTPPVEAGTCPITPSIFALPDIAPSDQLRATVPSPLLRSAASLLSLQHSMPMQPQSKSCPLVPGVMGSNALAKVTLPQHHAASGSSHTHSELRQNNRC